LNSSTTYDYAIIGLGAAGANLALQMVADAFFASKSILIIDENLSRPIAKKWSFWSTAQETAFPIIKTWRKANFISTEVNKEIDLEDYRYRTVDANAFRAFALNQVKQYKNTRIEVCEVLHVNERPNAVEILTNKEKFTAAHVFDSRVTAEFNHYIDGIKLLQHFKGIIIETESPTFDADAFTMMDFRKPHEDTCSFMYVLPFTESKVLFEFTFFSHAIVSDQVYDDAITAYLNEYFPATKFTIVETEQGVIPMTDYRFHLHNTKRITKIGTAGGWVKPSTGYSFNNSQKYAKEIVNRIKKGEQLSKKLGTKEGAIYDTVFLEVLNHSNAFGPTLFTQMYTRNHIANIFRFLDEETTFWEELKIMASFDSTPFLKSILRLVKRNVFSYPKSR